MQIVIDINDKVYGLLKYFEKGMGLNDKKDDSDDVKTALMRAVINGTLLPKGHGRLIDADYKVSSDGRTIDTICGYMAPTIIEADTKYEAKVITRGNCMMCGKELTEGLFFCKECEAKTTQGR